MIALIYWCLKFFQPGWTILFKYSLNAFFISEILSMTSETSKPEKKFFNKLYIIRKFQLIYTHTFTSISDVVNNHCIYLNYLLIWITPCQHTWRGNISVSFTVKKQVTLTSLWKPGIRVQSIKFHSVAQLILVAKDLWLLLFYV